tara:strand:+ start:180 stop:314 length:135 start_codon:yes stop_codon:yes gene_type:complete
MIIELGKQKYKSLILLFFTEYFKVFSVLVLKIVKGLMRFNSARL